LAIHDEIIKASIAATPDELVEVLEVLDALSSEWHRECLIRSEWTKQNYHQVYAGMLADGRLDRDLIDEICDHTYELLDEWHRTGKVPRRG
jgi:hypothetical protein